MNDGQSLAREENASHAQAGQGNALSLPATRDKLRIGESIVYEWAITRSKALYIVECLFEFACLGRLLLFPDAPPPGSRSHMAYLWYRDLEVLTVDPEVFYRAHRFDKSLALYLDRKLGPADPLIPGSLVVYQGNTYRVDCLVLDEAGLWYIDLFPPPPNIHKQIKHRTYVHPKQVVVLHPGPLPWSGSLDARASLNGHAVGELADHLAAYQAQVVGAYDGIAVLRFFGSQYAEAMEHFIAFQPTWVGESWIPAGDQSESPSASKREMRMPTGQS